MCKYKTLRSGSLIITIEKRKADFSGINEDVFYKFIYPLCAMEFLLSNTYGEIASEISSLFILNSMQWDMIRTHWEEKNEILNQ